MIHNSTLSCLREMATMLLLLSPICSQAQSHYLVYQCTENVPHWKNGAYYETSDNNWLVHYDERETYSIDGKTYMKVYSEPEVLTTAARRTPRPTNSEDPGPRTYTLGIRKADGKVLVNLAEYRDHLSKVGFDEFYVTGFLGNPDYLPYHLTDDGEMILYDYTMKVGDQYRHVDGYDDVTVTNKDVVVLKDGKEHRRLVLSNGLELVEDLGCINSTGLLLDYLNPVDGSGWLYANLQWAAADDNILFEKVVSSVNGLKAPGELHTQTFDLLGRPGSVTSRPGIYIQGGRKYMVR